MISRVDAGTTRDFTAEELDAMHRHPDTSEALNAARRNAGQRGEDVQVHGNDGTLDEELEHKQMHVSKGEILGTEIHAIEIGEAIGVHLPWVGHVLEGPVGIVTLGVGTLVASQVSMAEMQNMKEDLRDAATRDTLRAGMLMSLELPSGYVDSEIHRLGVSTRATDPATKIRNQLAGTPLGAAVQLRCDQGVTAAQDFLCMKTTKEGFLAASPKIAERYAADPAFHAGFDAYVWATTNAPKDAAQLRADVQARDARYERAHVEYRI